MKTIIRIHLLAAIWLYAFAGFSPAQQMPQDNWRYDGLEFSGPTSTNYLRSIALGSGGVYVGECGTSSSSAATKVIQFSEAMKTARGNSGEETPRSPPTTPSHDPL